MDTFHFSMFLLALPVLVIALYYLFFSNVKGQNYLKPLFYFLLIVSGIIFIWGIISLIVALVSGVEVEVSKPGSILFIASILAFALSVYNLLFRKMKQSGESKFIQYFLLMFSAGVVTWGIVSIIVTRVIV